VGNEGLVVDVGDDRHDHPAVHAVRHASMPRDAVPEVLNLANARFKLLTKKPPKGAVCYCVPREFRRPASRWLLMKRFLLKQMGADHTL
jgi:hypothetical protein